MLKESKKSVRLFFAIISFLYFVMGAGAVSQLIIFINDNPGAHLAPLFLTQTAFRIFIALAFGYVALKFSHLITDKPKTIKGILHFNFWGSIVFLIIFIILGTKVNFIGLVISALVYVYLLKSVDRLSKEEIEPKTA